MNVVASSELKAFQFFLTDAGQMILSHLEKTFATEKPSFLQDKNGNYDPIKAAIRDGQRSVLLQIRSFTEQSTHGPTEKTPTLR